MRYGFSKWVDPDVFERFARLQAEKREADLFMSGQGRRDETLCMMGVSPCAHFHVAENTGRAELSEFLFSNGSPALGLLSYGYGLVLKGLATDKKPVFPLGCFKKYSAFVRYDRESRELEMRCRDKELCRTLEHELAESPKVFSEHGIGFRGGRFSASMTREEYVRGVERVLEHIRQGDTYQLNLSIKFSGARPKLDGCALFFRLLRDNPAPFYAWYNIGQKRIISSSPERFLKVRDGDVLSQPIKGTARIGSGDQGRVAEMARELAATPKEDAELSMIVDLMRNDISANCEYGSVRVSNHKSVFRVDDLLQMYSDVHGRLAEPATCLDLLLDAFPGGSVTGCPKHRSMRIIEELEPHSRDMYCGSMVAVMDKGNMDSSIAIRTAWHDLLNGEFSFYAGSGIVIDSDPEREYRETMAKADKFFRAGER